MLGHLGLDSDAGNGATPSRSSIGRSGSVLGVPKLVAMKSTSSLISLYDCTDVLRVVAVVALDHLDLPAVGKDAAAAGVDLGGDQALAVGEGLADGGGGAALVVERAHLDGLGGDVDALVDLQAGGFGAVACGAVARGGVAATAGGQDDQGRGGQEHGEESQVDPV